MIDREKVINDLSTALVQMHGPGQYTPEDVDELETAAWKALELLKEQEAVVPILIREGRNKNYNDYVCPRCDNEVVYEQNYCSECGVKFMWEGR